MKLDSVEIIHEIEFALRELTYNSMIIMTHIILSQRYFDTLKKGVRFEFDSRILFGLKIILVPHMVDLISDKCKDFLIISLENPQKTSNRIDRIKSIDRGGYST